MAGLASPAAGTRSRHCLVLTQWVAHLDMLAEAMPATGHDPVVPRGGMGARNRAAAPAPAAPARTPPLLVVVTGPYAGEGFDCPPWTPCSWPPHPAEKGRLVQYAGRILRPYPGKQTAEVHDYRDVGTGVLDATLAGRSPATPASASPTRGTSWRPSATSTSQ